MTDAVRTALERWSELTKPQNLERLKVLLSPGMLADLTAEEMEELLQKLPQIGAIGGRSLGSLRIVSLGYHAHIQGKDRECPYPVDFFVRVGGILSSVNLVLRLPLDKFLPSLFQGKKVGPRFDLLDALRELNENGLGLKDLELVQQLMYRPCVPNKYRWSTPGGVQVQDEDTWTRGLKELSEEAEGLTVIASRVLLRNREYQGGNIPEFHSVIGVLCVGNPNVNKIAKQEGITAFCFIPLHKAPDWFDDFCSIDPSNPACNLPGGKTEHALLKLFYLCGKEGIH